MTKPKADSPIHRTTIRVPVDLKRKAQHLALDMGIDFQDLVVEALKLMLAKKGGTR